jgi:hypothetical protein
MSVYFILEIYVLFNSCYNNFTILPAIFMIDFEINLQNSSVNYHPMHTFFLSHFLLKMLILVCIKDKMYDHIMLKLVQKEVLNKKDNLDRYLINQYSFKINLFLKCHCKI